jgi:hypothetical protein
VLGEKLAHSGLARAHQADQKNIARQFPTYLVHDGQF